MKKIIEAEELLKFINNSPTAFHATINTKLILDKNGFKELNIIDKWDVIEGGKYYVMKNSSSIIAFSIGKGNIEERGFKIIGAHTDSPCFRLKPATEIMEDNIYLKLNVEAYGAMILNTWMDRPLSIAGRATIRGKSIMNPETLLIDFKRPIAIIPNLAIHLNPTVNEGVALNKQIDMLPILSMINKEIQSSENIMDMLSQETGIPKNSIIDYDLMLYEYEKGSIVGLGQEYISASRLDDLAMVFAGATAIAVTPPNTGINILACFDNEEVGSLSKQGADSELLSHTLERIVLTLGGGREEFIRAINNSFMISADMTHGIHPNRKEKYDPINRPEINKGPVIKVSGNQKYTSDSYSSTVYEELCKASNIPFQKFTNRSDEKGGSTIGPIMSSHLEIPTVDIGNPILAMHSIRELGGVLDQGYVTSSFKEFYKI